MGPPSRGHDLEWVQSLNRFATGGLLPDCTILLDLDPEEGLGRQSDRNRMEGESLDFHQRVREGYLDLAAVEPDRISVHDASESPEQIHALILVEVMMALGKSGLEPT